GHGALLAVEAGPVDTCEIDLVEAHRCDRLARGGLHAPRGRNPGRAPVGAVERLEQPVTVVGREHRTLVDLDLDEAVLEDARVRTAPGRGHEEVLAGGPGRRELDDGAVRPVPAQRAV